MHDSLCPLWTDRQKLKENVDCETCTLIDRARQSEARDLQGIIDQVLDERDNAYALAAADAASRILDYAEAHHERHSPTYNCGRCDITAAYRHAATLAKGAAGENSRIPGKRENSPKKTWVGLV